MFSPTRRLLASLPLLILGLLGAIVITGLDARPTLASGPAERVVEIASKQIGKPYQWGATGPSAFDCSGLVYYSYQQAGQLARIGGSRRTASGYLQYFSERKRTSVRNPRLGDLVVWGSGKHMGIYVGNGRSVSALTSGVTNHGVSSVTIPFTSYLHTGLVDDSAVSSSSTVAAIDSRKLTAKTALRSGPGFNRSIIKRLAAGTRVEVLRVRDGWLKVRVGVHLVGWLPASRTR